jgi:O-antigen ligase
MAELFSDSAKIVGTLGEESHSTVGPDALALLLALVGATIAVTAVLAPIGTAVVLGGAVTVGLTWLSPRKSWVLLSCLVVPAIGAGELWTFQAGAGTLITPSLLLVGVWAIAFFLVVLFAKRKSFWRLPLVGSFAAFWLAILVSLIYSISVLHWARGLLEAILGFAFFIYPWVYLKNRNQLDLCLRMLILLATFTVLFGLLQSAFFEYFRKWFPFLYTQSEIPLIEEWQAQGRMVANWIHPSDFGSLLNIAGPIAFYFYLNAKKSRLVPLSIFLLIATGIFLTATRTPIIAFCLSNTLLVVLMRGRRAVLYVGAGALALVTVLAGSQLFSVGLQRFEFSEQKNLTTVETRSLVWLEALSFFAQHPLTGIGARNFPDRNLVDPNAATHNIYIEVAAETGLFGLLAFLYLLYQAMRVDINRKARILPQELKDLRYALLCSSVSIMIESLTENSFYVWQVWCLFWLIRGLSKAIARKPDEFMEIHAAAIV